MLGLRCAPTWAQQAEDMDRLAYARPSLPGSASTALKRVVCNSAVLCRKLPNDVTVAACRKRGGATGREKDGRERNHKTRRLSHCRPRNGPPANMVQTRGT